MTVNIIKSLVITFVIFLAIDFVWLGLIAKNFYNQQLSAFSRTINWPAAILTYLFLVLGIVFFVLPKEPGNKFATFLWGAFFGLITYGVYDLTNLATLADWTLKMTVVDLLWGATVCGLTSLMAGFFI